MQISQTGIDLARTSRVPCQLFMPRQNLDWGWGSTAGITADSPPITRAEGEELLAKDLVRFERAVLGCPVPLNQGQYDALVSFSSNSGSLCVSTLRKKVLRGDFEGAADQFLRWIYAAGRRLAGLVRRREAERALFLS